MISFLSLFMPLITLHPQLSISIKHHLCNTPCFHCEASLNVHKSFIFFCPASLFSFSCLSWWHHQSKLKTFNLSSVPPSSLSSLPLVTKLLILPLRSILISWSCFHFSFTTLIYTHILPPLNLWISLSMGVLAFRFPSILLSAVILMHVRLTSLIVFELLSAKILI